MKDSGIDWLPEVPATWRVVPFKHLFKEMDRPVREDDEIITCFRDGEVTLRRNRREDGFTMADKEIGYQHIAAGDLVVHGMDGFAGSIGISDSDGKATPVLIVMNPLHDEYSRYFMYLLRVYAQLEVFLATSSGIRVRSCALNWKKLGSLPAVVPTTAEQRRIVDYLDERCAAIDEVRHTIEDEIEALRRLRKSTIHKAVTKGLDEGVPVRDSGVEWIGDIPETWDMVPNYAVFSDFKEGVGGRSDEYTLLSLTKQGVIVRDMDAGGKFPSSFDTYQVVYPGQMIFCLFDIDETPRTVGLSENKGMITGAYDVFNVRESVCEARFALYWYLTVDEGKHLRPYYRSLRKTLTSTMFRHVKMPLPPLNEQRRITDYLDERCAAIDSVIDTRTQQLQRLDDYRKALIFAYVTGKKEVPSHE
jgi:type I restriction enzyme S subunit